MATNTFENTKTLTILPTARRHVVRLNNISAKRNLYKQKNIIKSKELISTPVKTLAFFCNEYIPEHFPENLKTIQYILTINGVDYEVLPINSNKNGKKIVRTTEYNSNANHVIYLNEEIKSAILTIAIVTPNKNETPYISNLKILVGDK